MKPKPFETRIRNLTGTVTIDLIGELNAFAENSLLKSYQEALEKNPSKMVLNFTEVSYINSTGIALIVGLLAEARKIHLKLVVFGLSDHYVRIFQITRLADFMTIYSDEQSALASVPVISSPDS